MTKSNTPRPSATANNGRPPLTTINKDRVSDYEQQRLENIKKNQQLLVDLGLHSALSGVKLIQNVSTTAKPISAAGAKRKKSPKTPKEKKKARTNSFKRTSPRLRGISPSLLQFNAKGDDNNDVDTTEDIDKMGLMDAPEYWKSHGVTSEIYSDGHFRGWVNPDVVQQCGIEITAKLHWEKNSGVYHEQMKRVSGKRKVDARSVASTMLTVNPNQYFYRHCTPGVEQWTGEWTKEEYDLFMKIAKEHGCGDKWGLFSSYIPHRVGYQCANYYRLLLSQGIITDPSYKMSQSGKAIFCGSKNISRADDENTESPNNNNHSPSTQDASTTSNSSEL